MSFSKMIELLQEKDKGKIILVNLGAFYIARGKDAVLLNRELNLKVNCMETEICKVGFPINSLDKYANEIEKRNYSFIVYNYNNDEGKLDIIKRYIGKKQNNIVEQKCNCYICKNTVKIYKKEDKYIKAVAKLYELESEKEPRENNETQNKDNKKRNMIWIKSKKKKTNYN